MERTQKLLRDLISIESVNPELIAGGSGEEKIARHIGRHLQRLGLRVDYQKISGKRANVVAILPGKINTKTLMLNGHTDTVGTAGMTIPPFSGECRDHKIYGRGSLDMKGGLAAMLRCAEMLVEEGRRPAGNLLFAFVADEEYRSRGTEKLLQHFSADAAIVCEPTDCRIATCHKGFVWARVAVQGKAAHGSRPAEGIDAIIKAGKLLAALEREAEDLAAKKRHPLLGPPSLHASLIQGGREMSTYPDSCQIDLERRTIPGEDAATFAAELQRLISNLQAADAQFHADTKILFSRPSLETSSSSPLFQALSRSVQIETGRKAEITGLSFWTDAALLAQNGMPVLVFGPTGSGLHGAEEYVELPSVLATARTLACLARDFE